MITSSTLSLNSSPSTEYLLGVQAMSPMALVMGVGERMAMANLSISLFSERERVADVNQMRPPGLT